MAIKTDSDPKPKYPIQMKTTFLKSLISTLIILVVISCQEKLHEGKWVKLPAPISAQIRCFAEAPDGTYYTGTTELYKSEDQGKTWKLTNLEGMPLEIIVSDEGTLLVGTYRAGMFRSTDQGKSWKNVGFENNVYIFKIVQTSDKRIFTAATFLSSNAPKDAQAGVFVSDDDGLTWHQTPITSENIKGVFNPIDSLLFASGTGDNAIYHSSDNGYTWSSDVMGLPDSIPMSAIVELNGNLFASIGDPQDAARTIGGGIYISTDQGKTWSQSNDGLTKNTKVSDITTIDNILFVSTGYQINIGDMGVFKSEDFGQSWQPAGLNNLQLRLLRTTSSQQLLAGSNVLSIFISNDKGENWIQTGKEIENWSLFQVMESNNYLYTNGESGIWRAALPVKEWEQVRNSTGSLVKLSNGTLLIAENGAILTTEDNGDSWRQISDLKSEMIFLYELDPELLIGCAQGDGIFYSTNNGQDWHQYNMGEYAQNRFRTAIKTPRGALLIGTNNGTLRSADEGKSWQSVDNEFYAWSFANTNDILYAGGYAKGVRRSTDDGLTWTEFNEGLREGDDYLTVTSLCSTSDNSIVCGTLGEGIYISEANVNLWRKYKTGLTDQVNFGIIEGDNGTLYTTSEKGIFERK